jgi:hypothetical protein
LPCPLLAVRELINDLFRNRCRRERERLELDRSIDPNTTVRLWNQVTPYDDDIVGICVELLADDVRGALYDITLLQATGGLPIYLLELAEDFRGWTGVLSWEAPDHDLRIDAEYIRSGYCSTRRPHCDHRASGRLWGGDTRRRQVMRG